MEKLQAILAGFSVEMTSTRKQILQLQRRAKAILNASPWPLAQHFEIRVDEPFEQSGAVYFVNHKDKTTSRDLPPPAEPNEVQFPASAMPEYRSNVAQLIKLIERYNNLRYVHLKQEERSP